MLILKSRYIRNGIIAGLLMIPIGAQAFSGLTFYSTRLTKHACYNSKRKRLYHVAQILRQERVLFHQREAQYYQRKKLSHQRKAQSHQRKKLTHLKKVIPHHGLKKHLINPNQDETFFSSRDNRKIFSSAKIDISKKLATKIKKCAPVDYTVYVYSKKNILVRPGLINTRAG